MIIVDKDQKSYVRRLRALLKKILSLFLSRVQPDGQQTRQDCLRPLLYPMSGLLRKRPFESADEHELRSTESGTYLSTWKAGSLS